MARAGGGPYVIARVTCAAGATATATTGANPGHRGRSAAASADMGARAMTIRGRCARRLTTKSQHVCWCCRRRCSAVGGANPERTATRTRSKRGTRVGAAGRIHASLNTATTGTNSERRDNDAATNADEGACPRIIRSCCPARRLTAKSQHHRWRRHRRCIGTAGKMPPERAAMRTGIGRGEWAGAPWRKAASLNIASTVDSPERRARDAAAAAVGARRMAFRSRGPARRLAAKPQHLRPRCHGSCGAAA